VSAVEADFPGFFGSLPAPGVGADSCVDPRECKLPPAPILNHNAPSLLCCRKDRTENLSQRPGDRHHIAMECQSRVLEEARVELGSQ